MSMKPVRSTLAAACGLGMLLAAAYATAAPVEFRSIGDAPAVMYDAPSIKGRRMFIAPRGMPVEVVLVYGNWMKVRDAAGDLLWVDAKALTPKRNVVVTAPTARVRATAEDAAALVFTADKGVLLERLEQATAGWLKVRHRDGQSGFVKVSEVWGE